MYIVKWRSTITGTTGQGQPTTKELAELWAAEQNVIHPYLIHWVEPV